MKILHVLAQVPAQTGSGVYFSNLLDRLGRLGHQQRAVYAWQGEDPFAAHAQHGRRGVQFKTEALPFPVVGMSDEMPYESTRYGEMDEEMLRAWRAEFRRHLEAEREHFRPDAVVLHHLWMLSAMGAEIFHGSRTVGLCHNTDLRQAEKHPALKEQYTGGLSRLDAVAVLSERQKPLVNQTLGLPQEKMAVVGGGFDETIFHPGPQKGPKQRVDLVFAGKLAPSKGVFALVKAFKLALREEERMRLWVVGNATAENERHFARLAGGERAIRRIPALPQSQLARLYRKADVFVQPSYYEGLALSAVEALACGMRCVVSEAGDLRWALSEKVNQSGALEYVKLPRLKNTDEPVEEDLPAYEAALARGILRQARRALKGEALPPWLAEEMDKHSWQGVAGRFEALLDGAAETEPGGR